MPRKKSTQSALFTPELFQFLVELSENNDRDWFKANQQRYEDHVREPARAFIRAMGPLLGKKISGHFVADDKKVGGSLMRVHRDTRFSKDKTPYKTNVGIQFRHEEGKDVHAPGFYVHIHPDELFLGVGMYHPEREAFAAVREAIVEDGKTWRRVAHGKKFTTEWELGGDSLKRPPRGFDPEDPNIEDLKRKDFIAVGKLTIDDVLGADFPGVLTKRFASVKPFARFLTEAVGLEF